MEVFGSDVPKGTQVLVSPWIMHRDPRFFVEPERFEPERRLEGPHRLGLMAAVTLRPDGPVTMRLERR